MNGVLERAIESLARSGRLVRVREVRIGYMPPWRAALSGALAALLLTYGTYYWYALNTLTNLGLRWLANRAVDIGPPPPFKLFVYGPAVTAALLVAGSLLALVRRWSVRHGRFLIINMGPVAQLRAGWHVPVGVACAALLGPVFSYTFHTLPTSLAYLVLAVGSISSVILWEIAHDIVLPLFLTRAERLRALVELDLKEAFAQDETAVRWRVERVRFDARSGKAILYGEFRTPEAQRRVQQVALRVKGVRDTELVEIGPESAPPR